MSHIEKHFKFKDTLALVVGSIIGSGVFYLAPKVFYITQSPGLAVFVWIIAGIITMASGLTVAELAATYPKVGGITEYIQEAYGDLLATLCGWSFSAIIFPFYVVFLATKFGQTVSSILGISTGHAYIYFAIIAIIILAIANNISALVGAKIQNYATLGKMIPLILIIVLGIYNGTASNSIVTTLFPIVPKNLDFISLINVLTKAIIACVFAYEGWMFIGTVAGEMENPQKNLPRSIIFGILIVIIAYVSLNIAYAISNPINELTNVEKIAASGGIAAVSTQNLLPFFDKTIIKTLINIGIMVSVFGTLNGFMIFGGRMAYKMGVMRRFLFSRTISKLSEKSSVPIYGTLWISFIAILAILLDFLNPSVSGNLVELGTIGSWIFYILSFTAVIKLRKSKPHLERPYKVPLYPFIPLLAIFGGLLAIYGGAIGDLPYYTNKIIIDFTTMKIPFATAGFILMLLGIPVHYITKKYYKNDIIDTEE